MSAAELEARASAIYGPTWQTALARRLGIDPRTVRYWKAKEPPPWVAWAIGVLERHEGER